MQIDSFFCAGYIGRFGIYEVGLGVAVLSAFLVLCYRVRDAFSPEAAFRPIRSFLEVPVYGVSTSSRPSRHRFLLPSVPCLCTVPYLPRFRHHPPTRVPVLRVSTSCRGRAWYGSAPPDRPSGGFPRGRSGRLWATHHCCRPPISGQQQKGYNSLLSYFYLFFCLLPMCPTFYSALPFSPFALPGSQSLMVALTSMAVL